MNELNILGTASSGMQAERAALDIAARNVAAAEAAGPHGSYDRLVPEFAEIPQSDGDPTRMAFTGARTERGKGVDTLTEMISVLNATRAYEANASIFDLGKRLIERTIDVGRL